MDYKRLTDKDIAVTLNCNTYEDNTRFFNYAHRLWELENAIENGELDRKDNGYNEAKCSACNQKLSNEYEQFNYCPYCGARLR